MTRPRSDGSGLRGDEAQQHAVPPAARALLDDLRAIVAHRVVLARVRVRVKGQGPGFTGPEPVPGSGSGSGIARSWSASRRPCWRP
eukprot:scaffold3107_cov73-Phaeocystis_antarctica.AAC.3